MVTVFLSILNQMEIHLVQNRKEHCHHNHIPFDVKGNGNIVFSVYTGEDKPITAELGRPEMPGHGETMVSRLEDGTGTLDG